MICEKTNKKPHTAEISGCEIKPWFLLKSLNLIQKFRLETWSCWILMQLFCFKRRQRFCSNCSLWLKLLVEEELEEKWNCRCTEEQKKTRTKSARIISETRRLSRPELCVDLWPFWQTCHTHLIIRANFWFEHIGTIFQPCVNFGMEKCQHEEHISVFTPRARCTNTIETPCADHFFSPQPTVFFLFRNAILAARGTSTAKTKPDSHNKKHAGGQKTTKWSVKMANEEHTERKKKTIYLAARLWAKRLTEQSTNWLKQRGGRGRGNLATDKCEWWVRWWRTKNATHLETRREVAPSFRSILGTQPTSWRRSASRRAGQHPALRCWARAGMPTWTATADSWCATVLNRGQGSMLNAWSGIDKRQRRCVARISKFHSCVLRGVIFCCFIGDVILSFAPLPVNLCVRQGQRNQWLTGKETQSSSCNPQKRLQSLTFRKSYQRDHKGAIPEKKRKQTDTGRIVLSVRAALILGQ